MGSLGYAIPVSLGILAFAFFYLSQQYRQIEKIGRFELFFNVGNVFLLSALYIIFSTLDFAANTASSGVYQIFQGFIWIYVLISLMMVFKLLRNTIEDIVKFGGKRYVHGK
jgi:hypothetical protein